MKHSPAPRRTTALPAFAILLLGLALPACARSDGETPAKAPQTASTGAPTAVAEVAGQPIGLVELLELLDPQSRHQFQPILESVVDEAVAQKLFELEAAKRGISVSELLRTEVEAKAPPVTNEQVESFYNENQARIPRPLDQVRPQLEQYLGQLAQQKLREELVASLKKTYGARVMIPVERIDVAEAGAPAKGPADAPVTIIEFSDFECPFCNRVLPAIQQVLDTYGDQVRFVFRQFPLNIHPHAQKAAEASLCAADQGKFWEMHDAMFANQRELGVEQLKATAAGLGLDAETFDACLDGGQHAARIQADMADGQAAGITGTPALFVNGRFLNGAVPYETIAKVVDDELERKGIEPHGTEASE